MTTQHVIYDHVFTPEQANQIVKATSELGLEYNPRSPRLGSRAHSRAEKYRSAMLAGDWHWADANPIRLSEDWTTASDGLSRLLACHLAGLPLRSLVLVGHQWKAGHGTDMGASRNMGQLLAAASIKQATDKAAMARLILGRRRATEKNIQMQKGMAEPTTDAMFDYVVDNDAALDNALVRARLAQSFGLNRVALGAFVMEASESTLADVADFWDALTDDNPASMTSPPIAMRTSAIRHFSTTGKRWSGPTTIEACVKAWDAWVGGESITLWKPPRYANVRLPKGYTPA